MKDETPRLHPSSLELMLKNRIALITGGGRGIGRAIALAFAREGARIALCSRTSEEVEKVATEIREQFGVDTFYDVCDVANPKHVDKFYRATRSAFNDNAPDILVNNAGIAESATLVQTDDDLWHRHLNINLSGTFYCTRAALPAMLDKRWGRIINIASIAGKTGAPYISAYAASKHGVLGLTRSVAHEVAQSGITANAICPGYVDTEMVSRAIEKIKSRTARSEEEALETLKRMSPQHRLVTVEEVAAVALLLASDEGRGINGQAINVDGGSLMF
jgi:3-hydroxybutyrate dehydrogenase